MTLSIQFPPDVEVALQLQAAESGQDVGAFVVEAVREKIGRAATFKEICAPFAEAVEASGMSDEEFERFMDERRDEIWRRKQDAAR